MTDQPQTEVTREQKQAIAYQLALRAVLLALRPLLHWIPHPVRRELDGAIAKGYEVLNKEWT